MEEVCKRFPHLVENVMKQLDYQSLTNCKEVSRGLYDFFNNGRIMWKKMIIKNLTGIVKEVIKCTSTVHFNRFILFMKQSGVS